MPGEPIAFSGKFSYYSIQLQYFLTPFQPACTAAICGHTHGLWSDQLQAGASDGKKQVPQWSYCLTGCQ
jgi:hypothetical protein